MTPLGSKLSPFRTQFLHMRHGDGKRVSLITQWLMIFKFIQKLLVGCSLSVSHCLGPVSGFHRSTPQIWPLFSQYSFVVEKRDGTDIHNTKSYIQQILTEYLQRGWALLCNGHIYDFAVALTLNSINNFLLGCSHWGRLSETAKWLMGQIQMSITSRAAPILVKVSDFYSRGWHSYCNVSEWWCPDGVQCPTDMTGHLDPSIHPSTHLKSFWLILRKPIPTFYNIGSDKHARYKVVIFLWMCCVESISSPNPMDSVSMCY